MKQLIWLLVLAAAGALGYWTWLARRWRERQRAAEDRLARFMVEAQLAAREGKPASTKAPDTAGPG